jgi:hypothetical protein
MLPSNRRQIGFGAQMRTRRRLTRLVEIAYLGIRERRNAFRKIGMDPAQEVDQVPPFLAREPGKGLGPDLVREVQDAGEDRPCLVGQNEPPGPAITWLRAPLDPAVLFHAVDLAHQGHRLDLEQIGETCLVDAFVARKVAEHPALSPGQAEKQQRTLIEASPEKASHIVDEKSETAIETDGTHER